VEVDICKVVHALAVGGRDAVAKVERYSGRMFARERGPLQRETAETVNN